jgi:hypothetical protein
MKMIKLSKASKMPCKSWSLQAIDTCPGSIDPTTGGLVPACQGCYATDGNYRFPNVKAPRIHNQSDWQRDEWVDEMVALLEKESFFRWFDSGDVYHIKLARKIHEVMILTPHVKHWLPTRMYKFDKFLPVLNAMNDLPNVVVRFSNDGIHGERIKADFQSTIVPFDYDSVPLDHVCRAYDRAGKCGDCRMCWDKDIPVLTYLQHGRKMAKVNRELSLKIAA